MLYWSSCHKDSLSCRLTALQWKVLAPAAPKSAKSSKEALDSKLFPMVQIKTRFLASLKA